MPSNRYRNMLNPQQAPDAQLLIKNGFPENMPEDMKAEVINELKNAKNPKQIEWIKQQVMSDMQASQKSDMPGTEQQGAPQ